MTRRLGVLGGTFDPIHVGHLDAADEARRALGLTDTVFVPSHDPPHRRPPYTTAFQRFALLALALDGRPGCRVSDLELVRAGRSYTSDTLVALHNAGWPPWQIFFIIGTDAFAEITTWHAFPAVLDAAHFAVVTRAGNSETESLTHNPELQRRIRSVADIPDGPGTTGLFVVEARTRDVSSTDVRARLARGQSIDDLVPPSVARHILANGLYRMESSLHDDKEAQSS